jgi:hypothetical protein
VLIIFTRTISHAEGKKSSPVKTSELNGQTPVSENRDLIIVGVSASGSDRLNTNGMS